MKKTILLTSVLSMLTFGAMADDGVNVAPRAGGMGGPRGGGDIMANLTDEQKACITAYGCEMPTPPAQGERPEPGTRPEMSDKQKSAMECMQKAMESCGIEMPTRPEKPAEQ